MRRSAAAVIAAAGREAAGMSRRFANRYVDLGAIRSFGATFGHASRSGTTPFVPGRTAEFAARIAADRRIAMRIDGFPSRVSGLLDAVSRTVSGGSGVGAPRRSALGTPAPARSISEPDTRQVPRRVVSGAGQPFRLVSRPAVLPRRLPSPALARAMRSVPQIIQPGIVSARFPAVPAAAFPRTAGGREVTANQRSGGMPLPVSRPDRFFPTAGRSEAVPPAAWQESRDEVVSTSDTPDYRRLGPTALRDTLRRKGGHGAALESSLRERLRGPLRFDPSQARLHRGQAAVEAARALSAQAFTIGRDVFFGEGRYEPTSRVGLELLAHELMHVGQQTRRAGAQMRFFTASGGDALEEEAQQAASRVHQMTPMGGPSLQNAFTQPDMQLAMPPSGANGGATTTAAFVSHDHSGYEPASGHSALSARSVADHVYGLMKQEVAHGNRRGQAYRKG